MIALPLDSAKLLPAISAIGNLPVIGWYRYRLTPLPLRHRKPKATAQAERIPH
jgi:hypothetical protein